MTTVPSMTEDMKQRTGEKKYVWEVSVYVRPMLRQKEEADDKEKTAEGDVETTHKEEGKEKLFVMIIVFFILRGMIPMSSHHQHHERATEDEKKRDDRDAYLPTESIGGDQQSKKHDEKIKDPDVGNRRFHG